jgi:site-specific DNA-methyltransferase (adenine-specific)
MFDRALHNPDILNCLANLSNDEVFTPPELANQMLDLLPPEIWKSKTATFLDPCTKTGVFLREITRRLVNGLADQIPNRQKRIDHILTKQVFGIAITELTSLVSRRTLYCSKNAAGRYSISRSFRNCSGNIRFREGAHLWRGGGCRVCGAAERDFRRGGGLDTHAYEFIHTDTPERIFNMKFDVVVGNPPYQISDGGGTGDSARPIYHLFIQQALKLNPRFISMIVPSRWMKGGKGLDKFREDMMGRDNLSKIVDFEDAKMCFPGVNIDGGVCYFLIDNHHAGNTDHLYVPRTGEAIQTSRKLKSSLTSTIIRDPRQVSIIKKVLAEKPVRFASIVSSRKPFGISADFFNQPDRYREIEVSDVPKRGFFLIHGVKGKKGGAVRVSSHIKAPRDRIKNHGAIDKYKLFFSKAYMTTSTVPPEIILGGPGEICTETFLSIGPFNSRTEAENCLSYIKTKFFRALLFFNRSSLNISKDTFELVPILSFKEPPNDKALYNKHNLTQKEVEFIENTVMEMK